MTFSVKTEGKDFFLQEAEGLNIMIYNLRLKKTLIVTWCNPQWMNKNLSGI